MDGVAERGRALLSTDAVRKDGNANYGGLEMSGFLSAALSQLFQHGSAVIDSVNAVRSLSSDDFATVSFTHYANDEDGAAHSILAGVVFDDEETAQKFLDALIELLAEDEGDDE